MPLHPQAQEVINATRALGLPPNHTVSPAEARANAAKRPRGPGPEVGKVENRASPVRLATFRCASTRRRATGRSPYWCGTTAAAGW